MTHAQSRNRQEIQPPARQDLTRIRGIGPAIEKRLHAAGIFTYTQLAAMPLEDLAALFKDLTGLSAEQIAQKDWLGNARRLAAESEPGESEVESSTPESRQHYAVFTIELLLDEENAVRRTRAIHVQSQAEATWAGWEEIRLLNFLVTNAGLNIRQQRKSKTTEKGPAETGALQPTLPVEAKPVSAIASISGDLRLHEIAVRTAEGEAPQRLVRSDRPFNVQLTLDLTHVAAPKDTPFGYSAMVYAKKLGNGANRLAGSAKGTLLLTDQARVYVKDIRLSKGTYRIEGCVTLEPPSTGGKPSPGLTAMMEGGLFQIY